MGYPARVAKNILPLSLGDSLPEAFNEWRFTGAVTDHEIAEETCELCEQENVRYHFTIDNQYNQNSLEVGSHCILKFDVAVYDDYGRLLSGDDPRKHLDKLTKKMQLESCLRALEKLASVEENPILTSALIYYRKNKKLTPKFAFVVFWRLQENGVDFHPSFFSITLAKKRWVDDLQAMPTDRVHLFWGALTGAQRKKANELGHSSPQK